MGGPKPCVPVPWIPACAEMTWRLASRPASAGMTCFVLLSLMFCSLPAYAFEAGAAKVEITAPVGTPMNGYGNRNARGSIGVHDPLWARCLYLDDGQTDVFIINCDLVFINPELRARVLELAPDGVVRDHIILTATHTHYAQGAMNKKEPLRFVAGGFNPDVLEKTAAGIARAMDEALKNKQRAAIGYGTIEQKNLTANRRFDGGPTDTQIGVILVENADGTPISVVANMAAHPTSVPDEDLYLMSADYPGFYYQEMEALTSANCVPLFLNGAEGNQTIQSPEGTSGWARTEKVGRMLAQRVKEALDKIECKEEALTVGYAEPLLPPTLASAFQPPRTVLHTLEIGGLLMTFFPGEPCVEIGLEMRRRALETGYAANFTVGLSNDYLNYFVPPELYDDLIYENAMNFFGPNISSFFFDEFGKLMTKKPMPPEGDEPEPVQIDDLPNARKLTLNGDAYQRGFQRGKAMAEDLAARFKERVVENAVPGKLLPDAAPYTLLPSFIDPAPFLLPIISISARPRLAGAAPWQLQLVAGMADGAGMAFDALWMIQSAPAMVGYEDKAQFTDVPLCTMFAMVGERASGGLLIGRNLDWALPERPLLIEESGPDTARTIQAGFTWNTGVFTGMNEHGVVVALQRLPDAPPQPLRETPLEMHLGRVLAEAKDYSAALAMLSEVRATSGIVLLGGFTEKGPHAAVLRYAGAPKIDSTQNGYLPAVNGDTPNTDADTIARYTRIAELSTEAGHLMPGDVAAMLANTEGEGNARVYNEETAHSVVFDPAKRSLLVAFPGEDHGPLKHGVVKLGAGQ